MLYVSNFMAGSCISRVLSLDPVCQENFIPWTFTGNEFFTLDEDPKSVPEKQICHYCNTALAAIATQAAEFCHAFAMPSPKARAAAVREAAAAAVVGTSSKAAPLAKRPRLHADGADDHNCVLWNIPDRPQPVMSRRSRELMRDLLHSLSDDGFPPPASHQKCLNHGRLATFVTRFYNNSRFEVRLERSL